MQQYNIGETYNLEVKGTIAGVKTSVFIDLVCRRTYQGFGQPNGTMLAQWCTYYDFYHTNELVSTNTSYRDKTPVATRAYYEQ